MRLKYIYYVLAIVATSYREQIEEGILTIEIQRGTKHGAPGVLRSAHDAVVTARARHA